MRRSIDVLLNVLLGALVLGVIFLTFQPGSPVRARWNAATADRAVKRELKVSWQELADRGSRRDSSHSPTEIAEFSDYECPFCRKVEPIIDTAIARGIVTVSYHHFPLSIHPSADGAARASVCAESQGRFREMHTHLMATSEWQRDSNWVREAVAVGVPNLPAFEACLTSVLTRQRVEHDVALGDRLHVSGTPAFFSPTGYHVGTLSLSDLEELSHKK